MQPQMIGIRLTPMKLARTLSIGAIVLGLIWAVVGTVVFFGVSPQSSKSDLRALEISTVIWPTLIVGGIAGLLFTSFARRRMSH